MKENRGTELSWSEVILTDRQFLIKQVEPDYGLVDELYANEVLSDEEKADINAENTIYKRNAKLLQCIQESEKYDGFIEALKSSNQTHVVNYLEKNGIYAFDDDWPLLDRERKILRANQKTLIEILDVQDLLIPLYSTGAINRGQMNFISSKQTSDEQNRALLDILSRRSINDFKKTIRCLHESKQNHIAQLLKEGGVLVKVRAEIPDERTEDEIISQFGSVLETRSTEECRRILQALNVIALKKGESIVVYVYCKTRDEASSLYDLKIYGKLVTVLQNLFIDILYLAKSTNVTVENPKDVDGLSFPEISQQSQIEKMTADINYEEYREADRYFSNEKERMSISEHHLGHFSLKLAKVVEKEIQAYGNEDQMKTEDRYPDTMNLDMEHLPLEVIDIIIRKSFLSSRLEENEMRYLTDEDVIIRLASVQFNWFQTIRQRRFKNIAWRELSVICTRNEKTAIIIRNNRQFLESCIRSKSFIKQLKFSDCLTDVEALMIKRQKLKVVKCRQQHKICISDLLNVIRFCDKSRQLSFGRCLRQIGQRDASRVEMNGGVVFKADLRYSDAAHDEVVNEQMVKKLNELIQKIRNDNEDEEDNEKISDLKYEEIEILESFFDREAVVWIWCQSQDAFEYVQNDYESNLLADVFTIASKESSIPNISIDQTQFKREIVQNAFMFEIEENTEFLIESMDPNIELLSSLRADGSLARKEIDDIEQQPTHYMMNNALLQCILTKSRSGQLIEALEKTSQEDFTDSLKEENTNISRSKRIHIFKNLTRVEDIAAHMCQDNKLTEEEVDEIKRLESTSVEATEKLFKIIADKPRYAYECFLDALKETNQNNLYQILTTEHKFDNIWKENIKHAIANNNQFLMENMRSNPLIDLLHSEQLITDEERDLIKNQPNEYCTIREILHWINSAKFQLTSNLQTLIKCLTESDHNAITDVLEKGGVTIKSKFSSKLGVATLLKSPSNSEGNLLKEKEELVVCNLNQSNESMRITAQVIEIFGYGIEIVPCCRQEEDGIVVWFLCHSQATLKRIEELYKSKDLLIEKLKTLFQLLSKESHSPTLDSILIPESMTLDTDDFDKQIECRNDTWRGIADKRISGMAILGDEVFICPFDSIEVRVYHKRSFIMIRKFVMKGLGRLEEIVACSSNKQLYIVHKIDSDDLCMILAVDPQGNILKPFHVEHVKYEYGSCLLSVTMKSNIVTLLKFQKKLIELTAELALIREIELSIEDPNHFCTLPNGNFVVIYGNDDLCIIDSTGNVVKSTCDYFKEFGEVELSCLTVDKTGSICIAYDNNCLVFLTSDLEYSKTLHVLNIPKPEFISLDESTGLLYMAGDTNYPYKIWIHVCDVTDLKEYNCVEDNVRSTSDSEYYSESDSNSDSDD